MCSAQWVVFSYCWWFPLLRKNFSVWCGPMCLFFLLFPLPKEIYQEKILLREVPKIWLPMFSSRIFTILSLTLKSLIHFEFILVCGVRRWCGFIFCMYLPNFGNTINWIDCPYPTVCSCFVGQTFIDHIDVGLFPGSLFWSIDLYVCFCASTVLFWLLRPCSRAWYQVARFLQPWW